VYFSCLRDDPLYLYSKKTVDEHCTQFLEGIWDPFLQYVSSKYGPPTQLDKVDCSRFILNQATISAKNWIYDVPKVYDMKNSVMYKYLTSIVERVPGVKPGTTCRLKVSIPARESHPFWKLDPTVDAEYKLYIWDLAEEALEFEVCLWGPEDDQAKFNATHRAKDIIRNIRSQLNPPQLCAEPSEEDRCEVLCEMECKVFQIGKHLSQHWRDSGEAFKYSPTDKETNFMLYGYKRVLSLRPRSSLLLYYAVFSSSY
jgi:hypothetical protein